MPYHYAPRFSRPEYSVNIKAPDHSILPMGETLPPDGFLIGYTVKDNIKNYYYNPEDGEWVLNRISFGLVHTNLSFHASRDQLLSARPEISYMLDEVNIPMDVREQIIQIIREAIVSMANDPAYAAPRIMPILVEITAWYSHDVSNILSLLQDNEAHVDVGITAEYNEIIDELLRLSMGEYVPKATPAARCAIEMLAKVKLDAVNDHQKNCLICLEDFLEDAQLISMPCKHVFHEECIAKWLENSNLCPLCRFEMTIEPSG